MSDKPMEPNYSEMTLPSWLLPAHDTSREEHLRERAIYMDWLQFGYFMHYDPSSPWS